MDWQNKFYSIVRETEENLTKAKLKLAAKSAGLNNSVAESYSPRPAVGTVSFSPGGSGFGGLPKPQFTRHQLTAPADQLNMSAASGIQVLHMQEQIDAQNRTIDQLQKLVQSLDRERDFYKDQISRLQGEIDNLSDKMRRQMTISGSGNERQMSLIKKEVIHEIDKVKAMLSHQSRSPRIVSTQLSPQLDDELWSVKENLTESLDHIRRELRLMNKRIDRMESGISADKVSKLEPLSQSLNTSGYHRSPHSNKLSYTTRIDSALDVDQLRSTINLLNTKLDSLETRIDASSRPQPPSYSHLLPPSSSSYLPTTSYPRLSLSKQYDVDGVDDVSSISDLSNLSNLSNDDADEDDNDELDDEIEAIIKRSSARRNNRGKSDSSPAIKSSIHKAESRRKGKVEFDLSDLDLSDVEEAADLDSDSLDL